MRYLYGLIGVLALAGTAEAQQAPGWMVEGSRQTPPFRLLYVSPDDGPTFIFDCSGPTLRITETGVTELLDLAAGSNKRVPDAGSDRVMPTGSALMAIYTNRSKEPAFVGGSAVANSSKGWDITIDLPRDDKSFKALNGAEMMSLFTTGHTSAVMLEGADRRKVGDFVKACSK